MLLSLLSAICQAKSLTEHFIFESKQIVDFSKQSFSIKRELRTLCDNPLEITDTDVYEEPDFPADNKRQKPGNYRAKTIITLSSTPYSWLSVEMIVTVSWLLKGYWNIDSPLFNPIEQQEAAFMFGSEQDQQQHQPSEPSSQQGPPVNRHRTGSFIRPRDTDYSDGNGGSERHQHSLGLNCFVQPCHGVCRFRQFSDSLVSGVQNCEESSTDSTVATPEHSLCNHLTNAHCYRCNLIDGVALDGVALDGVASDSMAAGTANTIDPDWQVTCNVILVGEDGQLRQCGKVLKNNKALLSHKRSIHSGEKTCNAIRVGKDGQPQPCGTVCKNAKALFDHKRGIHSGPQTCDVSVAGEDGQRQSCGMVCKSATALAYHKRLIHSGQQTCNAIVVGEDGLHRPCGRTYKNAKGLSSHKSQYHTGQKTCDATVVGKDGQPQPCGVVCKNSQALANHKVTYHSGQKTCDVTIVWEDGQPRPCGMVCKNAKAMWSHKVKVHGGQKTCDEIVVGEDGHPQTCGRVCENAGILLSHKNRSHSGQKICNLREFGEDGQQRSCGAVCNNAQALSIHKRIHRKRKPVDMDQKDNLRP